ncbi:MAG: hypothetical protein ACREXP_14865, partial [Steroidobacteraceae bacterium]
MNRYTTAWMLLATSIALPGAFASVASAQNAPLGSAAKATPLLQQMVGTWNVQQKMWAGSSA